MSCECFQTWAVIVSCIMHTNLPDWQYSRYNSSLPEGKENWTIQYGGGTATTSDQIAAPLDR